MRKSFGYIRVSTAKQGEGVSLEAQKEAIEAYAVKNNIKIVHWFEEKETAAKKGRPIFNQMIRDLKRGKAEGLVIHKIDRSARNFADWARINELADAGYYIEFATESLDFRSRGGRLTADIQAVIAADYIRNLREECIKGMNGRLKQGLYPFKAPLGYRDNGGGQPKSLDPVRGPLVKKMYELYASGNYSLWSLVPAMNRLGLTNERGKPLAKTGIEKILKNPFYTGIIKIKSSGKIYSGVHQPLISVALFDAVQDVRAGRDNKKATKHRHTYRGLFRCGACSGAMIAERQRGHIYYRCHDKTCPTKTIREERIEDEIATILKRCDLSEDAVAKLREKFEALFNERETDPITDQAQLELAKLDDRFNRLTDKLIEDIIDNETFQKKKQEILLARKRWQEQQCQSSDLSTRLQNLDKFLEHVKSLYASYVLASSDRKREILVFLTSNRTVENRNVYIEPQKWLFALETMLTISGGEPCSTTSRTNQQNMSTEKLFEELCKIRAEALQTATHMICR